MLASSASCSHRPQRPDVWLPPGPGLLGDYQRGALRIKGEGFASAGKRVRIVLGFATEILNRAGEFPRKKSMYASTDENIVEMLQDQRQGLLRISVGVST